jgi:hypothetical protein
LSHREKENIMAQLAISNMPKLEMEYVADFVRTAILNGKKPFLHGPSGVGKTETIIDVCRGIAADRGMDFWTTGMPAPSNPANTFGCLIIATCSMDLLDVKGAGTVKDGLTTYARPDALPTVEKHGIQGLAFFDELSQASVQTGNALRPLMLTGSQPNYNLPDGWSIAAAGNRPEDMAGTGAALGAQVMQCFSHIETVPTIPGFIKWLNANRVTDGIIPAFLRFSPQSFFTFQKKRIVFATARKWESVNEIRNTMAPGKIRDTLIAAEVGVDCFNALRVFEGMMHQLPSFSSIETAPLDAKLPDPSLGDGALAASWAIVSMAAQKITHENCDAVVAYIDRLDRGLGTAFIADVLNNPKTKDVAENASFSKLRISMDGMII